jgi:hypothetical protein
MIFQGLTHFVNPARPDPLEIGQFAFAHLKMLQQHRPNGPLPKPAAVPFLLLILRKRRSRNQVFREVDHPSGRNGQ